MDACPDHQLSFVCVCGEEMSRHVDEMEISVLLKNQEGVGDKEAEREGEREQLDTHLGSCVFFLSCITCLLLRFFFIR